MTVLEAMAFSKSCLVTCVDAALKLLDDQSLQNQVSIAARKRDEETFTV